MRLPWHRPTPPPAAELTGWFKPQAPAASTPQVPGPNPGAGAAAPAEAVPPRPASPGTGPLDGIYGRCVMTTHFMDTGITVTDDHIRERRIIDIPPADEWGDPGFLKDTAP